MAPSASPVKSCSASNWGVMPSMASGRLQCGVVGVALGVTAVPADRARLVVGPALSNARRQVGVGEEWTSERHEVELALLHELFGDARRHAAVTHEDSCEVRLHHLKNPLHVG